KLNHPPRSVGPRIQSRREQSPGTKMQLKSPEMVSNPHDYLWYVADAESDSAKIAIAIDHDLWLRCRKRDLIGSFHSNSNSPAFGHLQELRTSPETTENGCVGGKIR